MHTPLKTVSKPRLLFRPDPVLGWSLSPQHAVKVSFRKNVFQTVNQLGWRHVPSHAAAEGSRVAFYGCSFTYGTGLSDDETFCNLVQASRPSIKVLNRGIGGHGSVQNFLQFRRDIHARAIDAAVFGIISDHRFRNIAHPQRMRQYLNPEWSTLGVEHVPVARLEPSGNVRIVYLPIWQPVIRDVDFQIFLPDDFMINIATLAVFDLIVKSSKDADIPVAFILLDKLDPDFNRTVMGRFPETVDVSTPDDENHSFKPKDSHPNAYANQLFAERILPVVDGLTASGAIRGSL